MNSDFAEEVVNPVLIKNWMPLPEPPKMDGGGEDG